MRGKTSWRGCRLVRDVKVRRSSLGMETADLIETLELENNGQAVATAAFGGESQESRGRAGARRIFPSGTSKNTNG